MATRDPWGSLEGLENLLRFLEPIDRAVAAFEPLQRVLDSLAIPAVRQFGEARRRDATARPDPATPQRGRTYIEVLADPRTPATRKPELAAELARRWSTDGGKTAARCTRKDLEARVRVHLQVAEEAQQVQRVYLDSRRVRDQRPVDLSPRDLAQWWINRVVWHLAHKGRAARPVGRRLTSKPRKDSGLASPARRRSGR
jgi:hypothetical protein